MYQFKSLLSRSYSTLRSPLFALGAIWCFGLLAGQCAASTSNASALQIMHSSLSAPVSLTSLILTQAFPLLLSCVACWMYKPIFILPIAFFKAFAFAFCAYGIVNSYNGAGWLMRWIILFSDSCSVILLLWFWFRRLTYSTRLFYSDLFLCLILLILICLIHYRFVYPISLNLVKF